MEKEIPILTLCVRIDEENNSAEFVGRDAEGNEYTVKAQCYVGNEWHDVRLDVVCTTASFPKI